MAFQATTGLGVAANIFVAGNIYPGQTIDGKNPVILSLTGSNGFPTTFQLDPQLADAAGNTITPGTAFTLSAVAASSPGSFTLSAVAAAAAGTAVYTGTITGGGSNAYEGYTFTITGFDDAVNNGTFLCTASTTTTLTLTNVNAIADTHAGTAQAQEGTAVYTGTITGGASNAYAGLTFVVAGFVAAGNNGTYICTASTSTTLTLANPTATAVTAAGTATTQEIVGGNTLKYVAYGFKTTTGPTYKPSSTSTAIVTVSATGLITAVAEGGAVVEISYPTFNNSVGSISSSGNIMNGLPINKIFADLSVTVVA